MPLHVRQTWKLHVFYLYAHLVLLTDHIEKAVETKHCYELIETACIVISGTTTRLPSRQEQEIAYLPKVISTLED